MTYKKGMNILVHHRDSEGVVYKTIGVITDFTETTITLFHSGEKQKSLYPTDTSTLKHIDIIDAEEITLKEINTFTDIYHS